MAQVRLYARGMLRIQCLTIHCAEPRRLAEFWAEALGWTITGSDDLGAVIECLDAAGDGAGAVPFPDILFLKDPNPKAVKNRLHLDLRPANQADEVARLEELGARRVEIGQADEPDATWVVMADPEGHEFCVLRALAK